MTNVICSYVYYFVVSNHYFHVKWCVYHNKHLVGYMQQDMMTVRVTWHQYLFLLCWCLCYLIFLLIMWLFIYTFTVVLSIHIVIVFYCCLGIVIAVPFELFGLFHLDCDCLYYFFRIVIVCSVVTRSRETRFYYTLSAKHSYP